MVFKLYKKTIKCASNWGPYKPIIFCLFPKFFIFQRLKVFYEGHFKGKFTLVENLPYQELLTCGLSYILYDRTKMLFCLKPKKN